MSKRKNDFGFATETKRNFMREQGKKHTLDSDEEDYDDEDNILDANDIEGEEDGIARQDEGQRMTAFNMKEEMEEGHFDKDGHFIWKNETEIRDNWLDNLDWQKIKSDTSSRNKYDINELGLGVESDSSESENDFDEIDTYKEIIKYLNPKETINKALKRLGGNVKLSSVERLRMKKAGILTENDGVTKLTELANRILNKMGNMDIYQETYEQINSKISKKEKKMASTIKEPELDMYADDFDNQEKQKLQSASIESSSSKPIEDSINESSSQELLWEFKWKESDENVQGPFNNRQMIKWSKENYFKSGVLVRKCGEVSTFYTSNRIDFELYE